MRTNRNTTGLKLWILSIGTPCSASVVLLAAEKPPNNTFASCQLCIGESKFDVFSFTWLDHPAIIPLFTDDEKAFDKWHCVYVKNSHHPRFRIPDIPTTPTMMVVFLRPLLRPVHLMLKLLLAHGNLRSHHLDLSLPSRRPPQAFHAQQTQPVPHPLDSCSAAPSPTSP
jgi:hypothetical protein